jgi:hypothetical protein
MMAWGEAMVAATPLGARFGRPEEIAPTVIFWLPTTRPG